jgi:antitoxin YefM
VPILNSPTARSKFFQVMDEVLDSHEPVIVTGKRGNVVILSEEDYRAIQETLYLVSIPGMGGKLLEGMQTPLEECVEDEP